VLEHQIRSAASAGPSLTGFTAAVASAAPTPGGGSVAAYVGTLAAALTQMVAGLTVGKPKFAAVDAEMRAVLGESSALAAKLSDLVTRDADSYAAVSAAYKMPKEPEAATAARREAIAQALMGAARVPLETAQICLRVAQLAATAATQGNPNAVSDAGVAALLAEAACRGAAYNVRINVAALTDPTMGHGLAEEAERLVGATTHAAAIATEAVERHL